MIVSIQRNELIDSGPKSGMVMDYEDISAIVKPFIDQYLDHHYLNESTGLGSPTAEALSQWIYKRLEPKLRGLAVVRIEETCTAAAEYRR